MPWFSNTRFVKYLNRRYICSILAGRDSMKLPEATHLCPRYVVPEETQEMGVTEQATWGRVKPHTSGWVLMLTGVSGREVRAALVSGL